VKSGSDGNYMGVAWPVGMRVVRNHGFWSNGWAGLGDRRRCTGWLKSFSRKDTIEIQTGGERLMELLHSNGLL